MAEEKYPTPMYWHYAGRNRIKAQFFNLYRAVPAIGTAFVQFIWKHAAHTPFTDMWIAIAIIIAVYLGLFVIDSLWSFGVLTPAKIYGEQIQIIGDLSAQNSLLEAELRAATEAPQISASERRRRNIVQEKLVPLDRQAQQVFRYILDRGSVQFTALQLESGIFEQYVNIAIITGKDFLNISADGETISVKAEFHSALEYFLQSEQL